MIIPVPTGIMSFKATSSRYGFFLFHCHHCGRINLHAHKIEQQEPGSYHVLQGKEKKEAIKQKTLDKAQADVDAIDDKFFNSINVNHNYEDVRKTMNCAYCNAPQVWSGFPGGLFAGSKIEAKKIEIAKTHFEPPVYYGRNTIDQLANGPYQNLFVSLWDMVQKGTNDRIADDPSRYMSAKASQQVPPRQTQQTTSQTTAQSSQTHSTSTTQSHFASGQSQSSAQVHTASTQSTATKFQTAQAQSTASQSASGHTQSSTAHHTGSYASTKPGVAEQPNYKPKVFTVPDHPKLYKGGWQQSPYLNELIAAYNQANTLHSQNDLKAEITLLKSIEQKYPGYANTWSKLGRAQVAAGDYDAALISYKKASKIEPHSGIVYCNIGALFMRQGHFSTAVQYYEIGLPEYFESTDEFAVALANYGYAVGKHTGDKQKAGHIIDLAGRAGYANAAKLKAML